MNDSERCLRYAEILGRMIRQETVSAYHQTDLSKFYAFHELLKELFPHIFAACTVEDYQGSLLLCWKGKASDRPLLFMNHHDVVEPQEGWAHPAFCGEIFDGKLWGRGTLDTKGGLFGMLQAADELAAEGFVPVQDIWLESSCCEETSFEGAQHFGKVLKEKGIRFDMVLDEGGMIMFEPLKGAKGTYAMIGMGERGCCDLKFTAAGNGGHASTPDHDTPLVRLGNFMKEVDKGRLFPAKLSPVIQEMLRRLSRSVSGPLGFVYAHPVLFKPLLEKVMASMGGTGAALVKSTVAFTMAEGSGGRNVIPSQAWVVGNMRVSHHQGYPGSLRAIVKLATRYGIETEVLEAAVDSPLSDYRRPMFKKLEAALAVSFPGVTAAPYIMTGCSDARFMAGLTDNCYHFVPFLISHEQMEGIHGINESVDVSTLAPAVDFYRYLMKECSR